MVRLTLDLIWLTTVLQCYDTVGCHLNCTIVPAMTYIVSSGSLNPTIAQLEIACCITFGMHEYWIHEFTKSELPVLFCFRVISPNGTHWWAAKTWPCNLNKYLLVQNIYHSGCSLSLPRWRSGIIHSLQCTWLVWPKGSKGQGSTSGSGGPSVHAGQLSAYSEINISDKHSGFDRCPL